MKNNHGFTLVELLAVIVILGSVSAITIVGITASLERRDEKECEEQIELVKNAAKIYFSLQENGSVINSYVTVEVLINNGYFDDDSKIDRLNSSDVVTLTSSEYIFTGTGECR